MTITRLFAPPRPPPQNLHFLQTCPSLLFPYLRFNENYVFYRMSTHQNGFFIPGMFYDFKVMFAIRGNRKVEDACNWPCCPHWAKLFGRSVSPVGGDLALIGGVEHPRICSIPKYRRFPGFPHGKPPPRLFVISPKSTAAPTVPLTMHLGAFSQLQFPMALQGLAYIPPAEWQC